MIKITTEPIEPDTTTAECMGYVVEVVEGAHKAGQVAYYLHGKRGARYSLIRQQWGTPYTMYVTNTYGNISAVKGNYWFSDRNQTLTAVS